MGVVRNIEGIGYLSVPLLMSLGWTVEVYHRDAPRAPEYWAVQFPRTLKPGSCAICGAVRFACVSSSTVLLITAFQPISADVVRLLNLVDGQVRQRLLH
jgi:hypothetical protein